MLVEGKFRSYINNEYNRHGTKLKLIFKNRLNKLKIKENWIQYKKNIKILIIIVPIYKLQRIKMSFLKHLPEARWI